jgi:hypothetical protein
MADRYNGGQNSCQRSHATLISQSMSVSQVTRGLATLKSAAFAFILVLQQGMGSRHKVRPEVAVAQASFLSIRVLKADKGLLRSLWLKLGSYMTGFHKKVSHYVGTPWWKFP